MKRSTFFLIAAILAAIFGGMLFLAPAKALEGFGVATLPEAVVLFRAMGALILGTGVMNFLVRNHPASETLKAVLWVNVISHIFNITADMWGVADGVLAFGKVLPSQIVHVFIGVASYYYIVQMNRGKS